MKKRIIIAGGNGFLGQALRKHFAKAGHDVVALSRHRQLDADEVYWDGKTLGNWVSLLAGADAVINLCGKSVDCRYTPANREAILQSRVVTTELLQKAIQTLAHPPKVWLNASSATVYVHSKTRINTEASGIIGDDFSMGICKQWESSFFKSPIRGMRKVALRTSIVLGEEGGAFPKMRRLAQFGLGGAQGLGTQQISWIHVVDFCRAIDWLLAAPELEGPINITAPQPVANAAFMQALCQSIGRSFGIGQSRVLLELGAWLIGTETELLLKSRYVFPQRLLRSGFVFRYTTLTEALAALANAQPAYLQ